MWPNDVLAPVQATAAHSARAATWWAVEPMDVATCIESQAPTPPPDLVRVTLTMTTTEASVLLAIVRSVGGATDGPRAVADQLADSLFKGGVRVLRSYGMASFPFRSAGLFTYSGSLYFKEAE